jgi:hypothetical protein
MIIIACQRITTISQASSCICHDGKRSNKPNPLCYSRINHFFRSTPLSITRCTGPEAKARRSITERSGRGEGWMANYFLLTFQAFDLTIKLFAALI